MKYSRWKFGAARWSIFVVLMLAYLQNYFHRMAPGVLSADLMAAFHTSGTSLGALAAMYFYVYAAMQIPSGVIADTLGTRTGVMMGSLIAGAGAIVFGLAGTIYVAGAGRFLIGLGVAMLFTNIMKSNSMWFSERRFGSLVGLTVLVGNLGAVLSATPLAALLKVYSWRHVMLGVGGTSFLMAALVFLIVRNRPEHLGFPSIREMEGHSPTPERSQHWVKDLLDVVRNRHVWTGFVVNIGLGGGLFAFMGLWGVAYLRDVFQLERAQAANHMTVMMLGCAAGALFFGWFSDWIGYRKPVMLGGAVIYVAAWLLMLFAPWQPGLAGYVLFAVMGFTGVGVLLINACAKEVCHPALAGMAVSLVNTGNFVGTALLQPAIGWVLDLTWRGTLHDGVRVYAAADYRNGFLVLVAASVASLLMIFAIRETRCRNIALLSAPPRHGETILP